MHICLVWIYTLKRIGATLFSVWLVSLAVFLLSGLSPIDPLEKLGGGVFSSDGTQGQTSDAAQRALIRRFHLDLPVFYFSLRSLAEPDTLYRIYNRRQRQALRSWLRASGNREAASAYAAALYRLQLNIEQLPDSLKPEAQTLTIVNTLPFASFSTSTVLLSDLKAEALPAGMMEPVLQAWKGLNQSGYRWRAFIPAVSWHGLHNQYHQWLRSALRGDMGISYANGEAVSRRIRRSIGWTAVLGIISVLLAYALSLIIGMAGAKGPGGLFDRVSGVILFGLDALPGFWVAVLLLFVFANPSVINLFPSRFEPGKPESLVLPLIAYTYGSLAYLSRLFRSSMLETLNQDFIRAARARGLSERSVHWRHAFRPALLPMLTQFAGILPAIAGGHMLLEIIFGIPGMGREAYEACLAQDMPMVMGISLLTAVLVSTGFLLTDLSYRWLDPRIRLEKPA